MAAHWSKHLTTWRIPVADRLKRLEDAVARLPNEKLTTADGQVVAEDIMEARRRSGVVDGATADVGMVDRPFLRAWWTGSAIERTWAALHRAEEALLMLADDPYVVQQAVGMRSVLAMWPASDTRVAYQQKLVAITSPGAAVGSAEREVLRDIRSAINTRSDARHARERGLRNSLLGFSVLLVLALVLTWLVTDCRGVALFPLPSVKGATAPRPNTLAIEAVAALGGLVSAVAFVQRLQTGAGPYNLALPQFVLKVVTGGAVGLFGGRNSRTVTRKCVMADSTGACALNHRVIALSL